MHYKAFMKHNHNYSFFKNNIGKMVSFPINAILQAISEVVHHITEHTLRNSLYFQADSCLEFLWGYLKSKVYEERPRSVQELKARIHLEIREFLSVCFVM